MAAHANDNQASPLEEALTRFVDECLQGSRPDIDEFAKQYPQCETKLKVRLQDLQQIDSLFETLTRADGIEFGTVATGCDLSGRTIGSFEIVEMIGRGGMGVVYLAHDTKLDRSVAIKCIPAELAGDSTTRMRFTREARLLASLNHPNIAAIHEIIEEDDFGYLVLEYVPGQTLARRTAHKPLGLEEALSIGQQVAEAVSAAHGKGIVHRDLKPGNIKITPEGRAKVLDFGLAKTSVAEDRTADITATQPGRVMGTPAYMSPEQACAKSTDKRSDIWAFGCLVYEMLTGQPPFTGNTAANILARIIEREPDWKSLPQDIPATIRDLLRRCLEKDPSRRLQHIADAAREIGETMRLLTSGTATPVHTLRREQPVGEPSPDQIKSLAILPLQNLTGDPNQEYFADGMTEALIANLGKIGALQVRSRTSIMQYKDVEKSLPAIARELNVDAVVEGSVERVAERVRITAHLIHALTDTHLWADSYERDHHDVLALQSEVAQAIASQIVITLTPGQKALLAAGARPVNPETYDAYLKGIFFLNKFTPEGADKGLNYLRQAIEIDPADPLAYGGLALGYAMSAHNPSAPPDAHALATEAALKALELDKNVAKAYAALALNKVYGEWDWAGAEQAFQRALELNPNLTEIRAHYSAYLMLFGRMDEASAQMQQAQAMDPLVPIYYAWQGWFYWWTGQYDEAIDEAQKSLELVPDFPVGLYALGSAYANKGMYEEAIKAHQRAGVLSREWKAALGRTYAMDRRTGEARRELDELESDFTTWDTWFIAQIYTVLGEKDEAFRWLEAAFDAHPHHPYLPWLRFPPAFKPLHDDPRFVDLLRRMDLLR